MRDTETAFIESIETADAELVVEVFDNGTGRFELAQYRSTECPNPVDVEQWMDAHEMRWLADALVKAADLLDDLNDE